MAGRNLAFWLMIFAWTVSIILIVLLSLLLWGILLMNQDEIENAKRDILAATGLEPNLMIVNDPETIKTLGLPCPGVFRLIDGEYEYVADTLIEYLEETAE
jgi:hypothetical protein